MRLVPILLLLCLITPAPAGQTKLKTKGDHSVVADKSKPVRRGLEDWYKQNAAAFERKDVAAIMALRTDDFHTLTPDGKTNDRKFMEARTASLVSRIDKWIFQRYELGNIEVNGDLASVIMTQDTKRLQKLGDGKQHTVESKAVQRETFRHTQQGWRLFKVNDVNDLGLFIDGKQVTR